MFRSTLISCTKLLLIAVISLPLAASAKSSARAEPVDLSILQQVDTLLPHMTASQKIDYLNLGRTINLAQSDLRTGQTLAATRTSSLNPDRDVKGAINRGEKLIQRAQQTIEAAQIELVALLTTVQEQKTEQEAIEERKFDYSLESTTYEKALATYSRKLLEACWELGYDSLFFDGAYILDNEGTHKADAEIRNLVYDTLVEIDGNTFSVTTPLEFQLHSDTNGQGSQIFSYDNASIFEDDQKALLAIEFILPEGSSTGLLSIRAIDLDTQTIAAMQLVKITDLAAAWGIEAAETEIEAEAASSAAAATAPASAELIDGIPEQVTLRNQANTLDILANLATPYTFEVMDDSETEIAASLFTHTLLQNSDLQLADSDFIFRAYGQSLDLPDAWVGQANARLTLEGGEAGSYQLSAQAEGSERILPGGTLTLSYSDTK